MSDNRQSLKIIIIPTVVNTKVVYSQRFLKYLAMFKTIKTVAILFAFIFTITSCLDSGETPAERTPEMEASEINQVLLKLEQEGYNVDTTELGIYYIVQKEGEGLFPAEGDTCYMEYTGYFLDGSVFDTSHDHFPDGIWEFVFRDPENPLIPGFEDGIALLNKGAEIDMIIPSEFAYGQGTDGIPPYTTLFFATKMHDLKPVLIP
ncbi:MAG: FKBP-type peptidyl-prolyl cis-trans isomerase [Draconibacterium sp.]|nr:FKBP-type peptidyl-prolyl cis-trans isomerase [Draconibacterium sp.]